MDLRELISEELIALGQHAATNEAAIVQLGGALERYGYIDSLYTKSVIEREQIFPTGIVLAKGGIAIPHATPNGNVMKDGISALQLEKPVIFHSMESAEEILETQLVFMLALRDSNNHLSMLQKLFAMFQSEDEMRILQHTTDKVEFKEILIKNLK